jgi:hypothetical protein
VTLIQALFMGWVRTCLSAGERNVINQHILYSCTSGFPNTLPNGIKGFLCSCELSFKVICSGLQTNSLPKMPAGVGTLLQYAG